MNEFLRLILFLPENASTFAQRVDDLHYFVLITTMVVSVLVAAAALLFFVRFRRREPGQTTPNFKGPVWLEASFVVVPLIFFLLWFGMGYRDFVWLSSPPKGAMDVYVMGKQWMWKFTYPEGPGSVDVLRVPAGRPVRLLMTSRDVIHSFFVPEFRIKQDVLPGRYTQLWFTATKPGRYNIFCTEYCGLDHSTMRGEVVVMAPDEYEAWIERERDSAKKPDGDENVAMRLDEHPTRLEPVKYASSLVEQGRVIAGKQGCLRCHTVSPIDDGVAPIGPSWVGLYGRQVELADGQSTVADEAYITQSMMEPNLQLVRGFAPVMPSYHGRLDGPQTAAVLEYIKSLRAERIPAGTSERIEQP